MYFVTNYNQTSLLNYNLFLIVSYLFVFRFTIIELIYNRLSALYSLFKLKYLNSLLIYIHFNILVYLDVIPLKCCISSLELLDSDMVPAIIEFYLDPTSLVKKTFLKILINHWVSEICEIKNLLDKIIDPFAYTQVS